MLEQTKRVEKEEEDAFYEENTEYQPSDENRVSTSGGKRKKTSLLPSYGGHNERKLAKYH